MCTVVISVDPVADMPVLLAGVRDEFVDRPWLAPAAHWPKHPDLVGGLDLQARGTWLAVHAARPGVAAVLNARGRPAPQERRRSRGELPLRAAGAGPDLQHDELRRFDPFHLVVADTGGARMSSWDGQRFTETLVEPGVHVITNEGIDAVTLQPRTTYFLPRFRAADRPLPVAETGHESAWGDWLPLVDGDGLDPGDPRAIVVRREFGDRLWGSTSATLVGLGRTAVRYDFSSRPGVPAAWKAVAVSGAWPGPHGAPTRPRRDTR